MANCHNLFEEFDGNISITQTKQDKMIASRDHERQLIRDHFAKEHPDYKPEFYIQGSNKMKTGIRTKDDVCDVDDGVYFFRKPDVTGETLQQWVKDALVDSTDTPVQHRRKCVRNTYRSDYEIDRPVYYSEDKKSYFIAIKNKDWRIDDPKGMIDWFANRKKGKPELPKLVKFGKAWCDFVRNQMPSGLAMTILLSNAADRLPSLNKRLDIAFLDLLKDIRTNLKSAGFHCYVPVEPKDDIFGEYDETKEKNFLDRLDAIIEDGDKAMKEKNQLKASNLWRQHLGDRFPEGEDKDESDEVKDQAAAYIHATKSKPFGYTS